MKHYFNCCVFDGYTFGGFLFYLLPAIEIHKSHGQFGIAIMILFWRIVFTWDEC